LSGAAKFKVYSAASFRDSASGGGPEAPGTSIRAAPAAICRDARRSYATSQDNSETGWPNFGEY